MKVHLTRASVAMGDDVYAPHEAELTVADDTSVADIIRQVARSNYLAANAGGRATWSAVSNGPLAVVAQRWAEPKFLTLLPQSPAALDFRYGTFFLFFNYHVQSDPEEVYWELQRAHLGTR